MTQEEKDMLFWEGWDIVSDHPMVSLKIKNRIDGGFASGSAAWIILKYYKVKEDNEKNSVGNQIANREGFI